MHDTPPEIDRLRHIARNVVVVRDGPVDGYVPLAVAERAVLDAIDRTVEEASAKLWHVSRREAFREAVEALREEYDIDSPLDWDDAARFIESRFLSHPDNPASDLMRPSGWQLHEVFDDDGLDVVAVHVVPTWETHRIEPSCWCEPREDDGVFIHRDELERSGPDDPEGNA